MELVNLLKIGKKPPKSSALMFGWWLPGSAFKEINLEACKESVIKNHSGIVLLSWVLSGHPENICLYRQ